MAELNRNPAALTLPLSVTVLVPEAAALSNAAMELVPALGQETLVPVPSIQFEPLRFQVPEPPCAPVAPGVGSHCRPVTESWTEVAT